MIVRAALALAASLTLVAGCGGGAGTTDDAGPSATPPTTAAATTAPSSTPLPTTPSRPTGKTTVIEVGDSDFGPMLFDRRGQAIYLFEKETTTRPRCYGACAEAWPPVLTEAPARGTGGVDDDLLGTTRRRGGELQVTYAGHPLYYYAHEDRGEVLCHDVVENGGRWLVVAPSGEPGPH